MHVDLIWSAARKTWQDANRSRVGSLSQKTICSHQCRGRFLRLGCVLSEGSRHKPLLQKSRFCWNKMISCAKNHTRGEIRSPDPPPGTAKSCSHTECIFSATNFPAQLACFTTIKMQLSRCHTTVHVRHTRPQALVVPARAIPLSVAAKRAEQVTGSLPQPLEASRVPFLAASQRQFSAGASPAKPRPQVSTAASGSGAADAAAEPPAQPQGLFVKKVAGEQLV